MQILNYRNIGLWTFAEAACTGRATGGIAQSNVVRRIILKNITDQFNNNITKACILSPVNRPTVCLTNVPWMTARSFLHPKSSNPDHRLQARRSTSCLSRIILQHELEIWQHTVQIICSYLHRNLTCLYYSSQVLSEHSSSHSIKQGIAWSMRSRAIVSVEALTSHIAPEKYGWSTIGSYTPSQFDTDT